MVSKTEVRVWLPIGGEERVGGGRKVWGREVAEGVAV